jgi:hypothetical protein
MIGEVLEIMTNSLKNNDWLTEPTKEKALLKLAKFTTKIGFPDKWKDFGPLAIDETDDVLGIRKKVAAPAARSPQPSPPPLLLWHIAQRCLTLAVLGRWPSSKHGRSSLRS